MSVNVNSDFYTCNVLSKVFSLYHYCYNLGGISKRVGEINDVRYIWIFLVLSVTIEEE